MWFQVLGPVRAWSGDREIDLGSPKQRLLSGMLLIEANRFVTVDALSELLWAGDVPPTARRTVQVYLSRLRTSLVRSGVAGQGVALARRGVGYQLTCDPELVDVHRFQRRVDAARGADDPTAVRLLREALALWRGPLLADVADDETRRRRWHGLVDAYLAAAEQLADAELRRGDHERLVDELSTLARQHPHRQRLAGQLMLALHRGGRSAEALRVFDETRKHIADELGISPSPAMQKLHRTILHADVEGRAAGDGDVEGRAAEGTAVEGTAVKGGARRPAPAQLPADIPSFTGRQAPLTVLDRLVEIHLSRPGSASETAMLVSVITGPAGVGKTALAVHWGHRVRRHFPDGQLYVSLCGFAPQTPVRPIDALAGLLQGLGCPADQIPAEVERAADTYRTLLADRRVLVVLDNAHSAEQVRALLPGSAGCLVVVTSRNQLAGLAAAGAQSLTLGLFSSAEARDLLTLRLGGDRVDGEPGAADEIIDRCARLPLALMIVAARATAHPTFALHAIAGELRGVRDTLDLFAGEDAATDVRAVFSYSYRAMRPPAARLFRLLGVHPGPDVAAPAAASLVGVDVSTARRLLAELAGAHLIEERLPGRYALHDLLRTYAGELTRHLDPAPARQAAVIRVLDHYLRSAHAADRLLQPHRDPLILDPPADAGAGVVDLTDHRSAVTWFTAERATLLSAVEYAADGGLDAIAWRLAWTLESFLHRHGHWHDWAASQRIALDAARRVGDVLGQAHAHRGLGRAQFRLGNHEIAADELHHALDRYREIGDPVAQANTHQNIAVVLSRQGHDEDELLHNRQALDLYRAAGHRAGQARTLNNIAWYLIRHGNGDLAVRHCRQALDVHRETGDLRGQAETWDSLGYAHHHLGQHTQAVACYHEALARTHELGDLVDEAGVLTRLGDSHHAVGDLDDARQAWRSALDILTGLGHPDADDVRTRLGRIDNSGTLAR